MANKIYINPETTITFAPSGGDVVFGVASLADNAGRISAQRDLGAGARAFRYEWRAKTQANVAPTVLKIVEVYLATSDGTNHDGNEGASDAALSSANKLYNMKRIGSVVADVSSNAVPFVASGMVEIYARYVSVVWFNTLGQALHATGGNHAFYLTPVPPEVQ